MKDVLGKAIWEYHFVSSKKRLWVHDKFGPPVEMEVPVYFRSPNAMPLLEKIALERCRGRVLDIGAGAGSHSLALQEMGIDVTALDISPLAVEVIKDRGVLNTVCTDVFRLSEGDTYDTLLLMMNGLGLASNLEGLARFLKLARGLIKPGGRIICDSSDIAYLYEESPMPANGEYYGTVTCKYEFDGQASDWFTWLYVDPDTLKDVCHRSGWACEILYEDGHDQYLAELAPIGPFGDGA